MRIQFRPRQSSLSSATSISIFMIGILCLFSSQKVESQSAEDLANSARKYLYIDWQFDTAAHLLEKVLAMDRAPAMAYSDYGWYLFFFNRFDEAMEYSKKAAELAPKDSQMAGWHAWMALWLEKENVDELMKKALKINPEFPMVLFVCALNEIEKGNFKKAREYGTKAGKLSTQWRTAVPLSYAVEGNRDKALESIEKILANPENAFDYYGGAQTYALLGDQEKAMQNLIKSYESRHVFFPWIGYDPYLKSLQNRPDFQQLIAAMNLPGH